MTVLEIRNPLAFDLPDLQALLTRATKGDKPVPAAILSAELRRLIGEPNLAVLVARADQEFVGVAIVMAPSCPLFDLPSVYHFYVDKGSNCRPELIRAVVEWTQERGYGGLRVLNGTGRSDATWERAFRPAGSIKQVGSVFTITFGSQDGSRVKETEHVAHVGSDRYPIREEGNALAGRRYDA